MHKNSNLQLTLIMLFVAIIVQMMPVTGNWLVWKPNFLLLVMIAWMLYFPEQYGIGFSVLVGVCADLVYGTTLGTNILLFSVCGAVVNLLHRVTAYLSLAHRIVTVAMLIAFLELLSMVASAWLNLPVFWSHIPYVVVLSSLFWIPLDKLVGRIHRAQS